MSRIIYKYEVGAEGVIVEAAEQKVVHVGLDPKLSMRSPCVWIEIRSPKGESRNRIADVHTQRIQYLIMGTGWQMEAGESYHVGSCITPDGDVWHVYGKELS